MAIEEIYHDLQRHHCQLILSGLRPEVEQLLDRSRLLKEIGHENCFESTNDALRKIMPKDNNSQETAALSKTLVTKP
jgi:sulfate permease, SulP family